MNLETHGMKEEKVRKFVDGIVRSNLSEVSEETGIMRSTLHNYKNKFQEMSEMERNLLIARLAIQNVRELEEQETEGGEF